LFVICEVSGEFSHEICYGISQSVKSVAHTTGDVEHWKCSNDLHCNYSCESFWR